MEDPRPLASLLERALSAEVAHRCRRAYVHEVKNGLQPIYSGLEALARVLRPVEPGSMVEKCLTLTRQALNHHDQALERSLGALTGADRDIPQRVDVSTVLRDLGRFMASDAAFRDVRLNIHADTSVFVVAAPGLLRLVLLSLLVDCIDAQSQGGELNITTELTSDNPASVIVQFLDTRAAAAAWSQAQAMTPPTVGDYNSRVIVKMLVASLDGGLEVSAPTPSQHRVRLTLPRAAETVA